MGRLTRIGRHIAHECVDTPRYATTSMVPAPIDQMTTDDEWCHQSRPELVVAYCGVPLPADEPYCGESTFPRVGTCQACGRPHCPDCIVAVRRTA